MIDSGPTSLRGRLRALVASSGRLAFCVENPSRLAAAVPAGNTLLRRDASLRMLAGLGRLLPNSVGRER